ncbi:MAG: hypothetical protein AB1894_09620 [Chloroflexota bacterium]
MASRVAVDSDTWWHLRAGQWMIEHRTLLRIDMFSYTRYGQPWHYTAWMLEIPMAAIYGLVGPGGLNLWMAGMITLSFFFVWRVMSGGPFLKAFILVLATATSSIFWAARPHLMTYLLSAIYLSILEDYRWERVALARRRLWWLPALMAIWANSHGGFAVGFILMGIYWINQVWGWLVDGSLWERLKSIVRTPKILLTHPDYILSRIAVLLLVALCINPIGVQMLLYPFKTVAIGNLRDYIQEWQSPNFHSLSVQPFIWLLLAVFGVVGISRRRLVLSDFLLVAVPVYMGLLAGRNVALFALFAPPVLARHAAPVLDALGRRIGYRGMRDRPMSPAQGWVNRALLVVLAIAVIAKLALVFPPQVTEQHNRKSLPYDAVSYLKSAHLPGELFSTYNWGGFLTWVLPEYRVFIDGRTDLYGDEIIDEWLQVARGEPGWQEVLDRWNVNSLLFEPNLPVVDHLEEENWRLVYEDDMAVIYVR